MYTSLVLLLLAKMAYTAGATKLLCKTSTCQHHALPLHPQINFGFFISIWFCQRFHRFAGFVVQDFIHTLDLWLKTPPPRLVQETQSWRRIPHLAVGVQVQGLLVGWCSSAQLLHRYQAPPFPQVAFDCTHIHTVKVTASHTCTFKGTHTDI